MVEIEDSKRNLASMADARFFSYMDLQGFRYKERPATIKDWVVSPEYLNLASSVRPMVLKDLEELFSDYSCFGFCKNEEAVFDEGIGSGKSWKSSVIITYILHHLLCLREPHETFSNIGKGSLIAIMNMSINATQAKKVVFGEIKNKIDGSKWFLKHRPDPNIKSELRFDPNICVLPGHSGETYPLGYNLIAAIMDEAAFYTETTTHDVAEDMYYALKRRINNRFGKNGLLIMISSPRYVDDFIERKANESKTDKDIFCRRHPVWEMLPEDELAIQTGQCFELDGVKIPNKYKKDFLKNPDKAWRDLGARPSLALEPYFKQWTLVEKCIDDKLVHPVGADGRFLPWFQGKSGVNYYGHIDLSLTRCACGVSLAHYALNKVWVDLLLQIIPKEGTEIDLDEMVSMMFELRARGFHLKKVTYDQFQSAGSIQKLNKHNIPSERLSVEATEPYETMKEEIYCDAVRYYRYEPFLTEMRRLELVKGKKIDHPLNGSKDVSDAACGAIFNAVKGEKGKKKPSITM